MAAIRSEKQAAIAEIKEKLVNANGVVIVEYKGLTVAQDTALRKKMREAGVEYRVVKNTLVRIAAEQAQIQGLEEHLKGTTAIAFSSTDPMGVSKAVYDFAKEKEYAKFFKIKAGYVEGAVVDAEYIKALASIPSREILIARLLGSMQSPIAAFARVVNEIAKKKEEESASA